MREDVFNKIFTIQISSKFINIPGEKTKVVTEVQQGHGSFAHGVGVTNLYLDLFAHFSQ